MSKEHRKEDRGTIHKYITRSGKKKDETGKILSEDSESQSEQENPVQQTTMPADKADKPWTQTEMQTFLMSMDSRNAEGFANVNTKLNDLTEKLEKVEFSRKVKSEQIENREEVKKLQSDMADLRASLLHTQLHSSKYNLLLYGVEGYEGTAKSTIDRVRKFAKDSLLMDEESVNKMSIRNAHRLPTRQRREDENEETAPATIIVKFLFWQERDAFLSAAKNLKGTRMSIRTDLPPELKRRRGMLASEAYEIRQKEGIQTKIRERGVDLWLETRRSVKDMWKRRF